MRLPHRVRVSVAALAFTLAGCSGDVTYTYFNVAVTLDQEMVMDEELMELIAGCAALAETPERTDSATLRCVRGGLMMDLGTFQYTTTLTSGSIKFTVVMSGINNNPLARGESAPVGIAPGKTISASLVVKPIPGAPRRPPDVTTMPDGGIVRD